MVAEKQAREEQQARVAQVAALRRERAGYLATGRKDRATEVAAVLAELGEPVDDDQKPAASKPRTRRQRAAKD